MTDRLFPVSERPESIEADGWVYELVTCKNCAGTGYVRRRTYREICMDCTDGTIYRRARRA